MLNPQHPHQLPGSSDDLRMDPSRCSRMRFCESGCRRCLEICPRDAIALEGALSVDPQRCSGCLLCTAACPTGALEQGVDFHACLTRLSRVPDPVLGCSRTGDKANATVTCLGGLAEEHLVALSHTLSGKVTLNLTNCGDCPNGGMVSHLLERLHDLAEAALFDSNSRIVLAQTEADLTFTEEGVGRRGFFKAFRNSIFKSASVVLSSSAGERAETRLQYSSKRLPAGRSLLSELRKGIAPAMEKRIRNHFDFQVSFNDGCTHCHGCVAICPTAALRTDQPERPPAFSDGLCTGCGLCEEFCLDGALSVRGRGRL